MENSFFTGVKTAKLILTASMKKTLKRLQPVLLLDAWLYQKWSVRINMEKVILNMADYFNKHQPP